MGKIKAERVYAQIGGMKQGMFIQSDSAEKPVLLFLHGGPGSPEIAFEEFYPSGLADIFTVCWWEQRGSGISYSRNIPTETMTIDRMIDDAIEVANYLKKRYGKEKVYIMGHSWGSVLGIITVQKAPELFYAYIGTGQVAQQDKSERLAYDYMLREFRRTGDSKMCKKLEKFPIAQGGEISIQYLQVRSTGMMKLGIGIMHNCKSMMDMVKCVLKFKGYSFGEKINYARGGTFSMKYFWDFVMENDFIKKVPSLDVPVYIFQGKYDYQVSYEIAKKFLSAINAPIKGFYTFENSAHSPCFEEPQKMCKILAEDVLQGKADLADELACK